MDPPATLKPYKDSTIAMIESATRMGWSCVYFTQLDLFCHEGHAYARVHDITIGDEHSADWV